LEKINKINKSLAKLTKVKGVKTQINKIRAERRYHKNTNEFQRIIREYFKSLHYNKLENLEEIDKFLGVFDWLKSN
jgi:hypothetical protein